MTQTVTTAADLKQLVSTWVDRTFNYISLENAEKAFDNMLFESIRSNCNNKTAQDFLNDYSYQKEYGESDYEDALSFVNDTYEDDFRDYAETDYYPMWSTLFEFRDKPSEEIISAAEEAGFGIIESSDFYNTMLFVKGAGYSFYSAHWIPMYLGLPWVDNSDYKNIDFSGQ